MVDVSNPASPSIVGTADTPDAALGVAVSDQGFVTSNTCNVADATGLQVIDVSTPGSAWIVGSANTPGSARGVAVSGAYAYIADGFSGLQVIDVSNPASPSIVGSAATPDWAWDVTVSGAYAYVAAGVSGLQVIDVTNPVAPSIVGSADTPDQAYGVAVSGDYAYVADGNDGLQVIDVTNPVLPSFVGTVDTPGGAFGVAVSGDYVYIADYTSGLQIVSTQCEVVVGVASGRAEERFVPEAARLGQSFPNPFNPSTRILVDVPAGGGRVDLAVYDVRGRLVRRLLDSHAEAGQHAVPWDGSDESGRPVASGVYFYRLEMGGFVETRRMSLVR